MGKKRIADNQKLAMDILQSQGKDYDEWLNEKHNELIISSVNLLSSALKRNEIINNNTNNITR